MRMIGEYKTYYKNGFFNDILKDVGKRSKPVDFTKITQNVFGVELSEPAQKYLKFISSHNPNFEIGQFFAHEPSLPENDCENVFKQMLTGKYSNDINQIFTGCIAIGADSGGQMYYLQLDKNKSEIYLYAPDVDELKYLACSLEAFAYLNRIYEDWMDFEYENDIDSDEIINGRIPTKIDITPFQKKLGALLGYVNLSGFEDSDVCSEFDEIFHSLFSSKLKARSESSVIQNHKRAKWIISMLDNDFFNPMKLEDEPESGNEPISDCSDALYWLWRYYFTCNDNKLKALCERCYNHKARLVRGAVSMITELNEAPDSMPEFNYLRIQRELVKNDGLPPAFSKAFDKDVLKPKKTDSEEIKECKKNIRKSKDNHQAWDELTYNYSLIEDWDTMLKCAEMSLALNSNSYYAWMQRGIAFHMKKNNKDALHSFDRGLCFSNHENLWLNKAIVYTKIEHHKSAINHLKRIRNWNRADLIKAEKELDALSYDPEYKKLIETT